jgi:hypothetical protein
MLWLGGSLYFFSLDKCFLCLWITSILCLYCMWNTILCPFLTLFVYFMCISFSFLFFNGILLFCTYFVYNYFVCPFDVLIVSFLQRDIANVNNMQWCQFVVDQLHEELSNGIYSQGCLFLLEVHIHSVSKNFSIFHVFLKFACHLFVS